MISLKNGFLFIIFINFYLIINIYYIKLNKKLDLAKIIEKFID